MWPRTDTVMNVIAGILIGWATDGWSVRLAAPFLWGVGQCLRLWITSAHRTFHLNKGSAGQRWGLTDAAAFYVIEYGTATAFDDLQSWPGSIRNVLKRFVCLVGQ